MSPARPSRTVRAADLVYGESPPALDDPAELLHEASRAYPSHAARNGRGGVLLERHAELRASAARATRRGVGERVPLPAAELPARPYAEVVAGRRSCRSLAADPLPLATAAALLHAAYGVTAVGPGEQTFRAVPSGGALYPLELTLVAWAVDGLEPGVYHFDPLARELERLPSAGDRERVRAAMIYPELVERAPALVAISARFWRSRFKYGLRAYRFTLLEAGHVAHALLLGATAHGLGAVAVGGFYDALVDEVLGVDGVEEASLYAVAIGARGES